MRKILRFILCLLMIFCMLTGCNASVEKRKKLQFTEDANSPTIEVRNNQVLLYGIFDGDLHEYIMLKIGDGESENISRIIGGEAECVVEIPDKKEEYEVKIYACEDELGYYECFAADHIKVVKGKGRWSIAMSPVYKNNKKVFESAKDKEDYLEASDKIQSDDAKLIALAGEISFGEGSNYDRVKAIHNWVAENIYYDCDAGENKTQIETDAKSVLTYRKGTSEGYANITAALIRSMGIPCRTQKGYVLGNEDIWTYENINSKESNHTWNEAYIDGRWVIIDTAWDSDNKYINGRYEAGSFVSDVYFDSTLEFISLSHKFI